MTFYNKLNANERLEAIGSVIVIISAIVGLASSFGMGVGTLALVGAIAVLAILYIKYSPTQSMTWPMPVQTILLGISAIVALVAIVTLLPYLSVIGSLFGLSLIGAVVGGLIMAWGSWQDYQAMPKTTPPSA